MKSNYISTKSEVEKMAQQAARLECQNMQDEFYRQEAANIVEQMTAMHLYILAKDFGFGKKRLQNFMSACNAMFSLMMSEKPIFGKDVDTMDVKKYVENKYALDITVKKMEIKEGGKK